MEQRIKVDPTKFVVGGTMEQGGSGFKQEIKAGPTTFVEGGVIGDGATFSPVSGTNEATMKIDLDGGGRVMMSAPQKQWRGDRPDISQTAQFAGQTMMAITDDAGAFDLLYLGYETRGFATIEAAKAAAPEFARLVLTRMIALAVE